MNSTTSAATELPDLDMFAAAFEEFHARFADLFTRSEPRAQAGKYLRGLLGPVQFRNGWQLAEAMGDGTPDRMQHLLNRAEWSAVEARDRLLDFSRENFGDPAGIGIVDETGFLKQGDASVGVARQYTGTAGKVENCQVGVFVAYSSSSGHVLLDRRLYLGREWCKDDERRARAHVPEKVRFHTKPDLAARMLQHAWAQDIPMAWVTGDEVYGNDPKFRAFVTDHERLYVLAVTCTTPVWTVRPRIEEPPARTTGAGRPRTRARLSPGQPKATTAKAVVATWKPSSWTRLVVHEGEKGPVEYDWAARRVTESRKKLPGAELWLLARRSVEDPTEIDYYLSNAPPRTPLSELARVASTRFTIEQCFGEAKDDVGLDQYEVRTWPAWHRHITLVMMAYAWLASVRRSLHRTDPHLLQGAIVSPSPPPPAVEEKKGSAPRPPSARVSSRSHRGRSRRSAG